VEKLIFLSAYDKRKFPNQDTRKVDIVHKTFGSLKAESVPNVPVCSLHLIGFDNETQGASKADWIKQNASGFDIVIDDNPNICREILNNNSFGQCRNCRKERKLKKTCEKCPSEYFTVSSPYYPAVEKQHDERVLLVKNEVSELKKEDFN